jgi:hypothetical protein
MYAIQYNNMVLDMADMRGANQGRGLAAECSGIFRVRRFVSQGVAPQVFPQK